MTESFFIHEPMHEYHEQSRSGRYMSSHLLADFRKSPALYRKKILGEVGADESHALALGRAAHALILEGRGSFDKEFIVADGPVNPRTGESFGKTSKAYAEWCESQEREVVSSKDYSFILILQSSVWRHSTASELLTEGIAEGVVRVEYCSVPCQIRMDWFSPKYGLADFKTCENLQWFESDARRYGYLHQMAFYRAIIREVTGESVPIHIIAVEKNEPFSAGVWRLTGEVLDLAEQENKAALERYKTCLATSVWPTGYEKIRIIDTL